ncbi:Gfo/Idh/MocA family oxidoreductase [Xanthovirga aplysinae]|uniref:Gfo/Idh/MocA family oxidoreductase n=1 Tax=Xanthovirga aplysinae TaxID=2529853 RepID=UPI0012BC6E10|nr:Gfo/Idh/MocA family oxidoreductase [Xanthovirga aplysinae]MTI32971.1 ornithine cyclodeaminase family protein [Xanthovirga aplysinae]
MHTHQNHHQPKIIHLSEIKDCLSSLNLLDEISQGFVAYSKGEAILPPVGEMLFNNPPGEVHIKYGYLNSENYYVIKIASGFYQNPSLGLSSSQGTMLLFDKNTGVLLSILLDHGHLTDVRTAVAGAIAAKYLAPVSAKQIGIVGTGIQAKMQLEYLQEVHPCRKVMVWGRTASKAKDFQKSFARTEWNVEACDDLENLCRNSQIIVTTTPSKSPLIKKEWIQKGTHITAIGSDTAEKIELDPSLLAHADKLVVDSLEQSNSRGEVFRAVEAQKISRGHLVELGSLITNPSLGRKSTEDITIADLTGLAVQDLMIAKGVFEYYKR